MTKLAEDILQSSLLGRELPFRIVLPEVIEKKDRPGVLFLLHGLFGSSENWIELTRLAEYARGRRLVIVMPDVGDSWYVDSEAYGLIESAVLDELLPLVEERFATSGAFGVAGLSMGGYGAIKFALKRPELFRFAASSSGAFHAPHIFEESENWDELKESVLKVFGPRDSEVRKTNDLAKLAFSARPSEVPHLFLDCGRQDSFLQVNREISDILSRTGIRVTYQEFDGGHDWDYWDARLDSVLATADSYLG